MVAQRARQVAAGGPAPVAIHDDRDVLRDGPSVAEAQACEFGLAFLLLRAGAAVEQAANCRQQVFQSSLCHTLPTLSSLSAGVSRSPHHVVHRIDLPPTSAP